MKDLEKNRSWIMRQVNSKNTSPEKIIRRLLTDLGYRYRLQATDLPGKPDIIFRGKKKIIFIHGCFWHGHTCKRGGRIPKTNIEYWRNKIAKNKIRDELVAGMLTERSWRLLTIWECELKGNKKLARRILDFLNGPSFNRQI